MLQMHIYLFIFAISFRVFNMNVKKWILCMLLDYLSFCSVIYVMFKVWLVFLDDGLSLLLN